MAKEETGFQGKSRIFKAIYYFPLASTTVNMHIVQCDMQ